MAAGRRSPSRHKKRGFMKSTVVAIAAGLAPTDVLATIPAHFVRIVENASPRAETLIVNFRQPDGSYSADEIYQPTQDVTHMSHTILAMPPNFVQSVAPAQAYCKIRTASGNGTSIKLQEYERIPFGN